MVRVLVLRNFFFIIQEQSASRPLQNRFHHVCKFSKPILDTLLFKSLLYRVRDQMILRFIGFTVMFLFLTFPIIHGIIMSNKRIEFKKRNSFLKVSKNSIVYSLRKKNLIEKSSMTLFGLFRPKMKRKLFNLPKALVSYTKIIFSGYV